MSRLMDSMMQSVMVMLLVLVLFMSTVLATNTNREAVQDSMTSAMHGVVYCRAIGLESMQYLHHPTLVRRGYLDHLLHHGLVQLTPFMVLATR